MAGVYRSSDATRSIQKAAAVVLDAAIPVTRAIYVGVTGNISAVMAEDGATVVFTNVPVGWFPIQAISITTANTIVMTEVRLLLPSFFIKD